jgi:hypothetical protein
VGADFLVGQNENIVLGLNYAMDFPIGVSTSAVSHRIFLNVGYRF